MFSGMIFIFAPLVVGYLLSISNASFLTVINKTTSYLVFIILFLMGLSLSALDNLQANLQTIIAITATFFLALGCCNLITLPVIDRLCALQTEQSTKTVPLPKMLLESMRLIVVVGSGLLIGLLLRVNTDWIDTASKWSLFFLLFLIGIQLRNSGLTIRQILINKHGMIIALTIVLTSWLGGIISALLLDIPLNKGLAMASGFGWYSLSGILMGDAYGPVYGGASFMIELLRELFALITIPILIRRIPCTAIGYAGATAMDFTLPVIQSTGGIRCVPVAIVSGFILSLLVPVFMLFFVSI